MESLEEFKGRVVAHLRQHLVHALVHGKDILDEANRFPVVPESIRLQAVYEAEQEVTEFTLGRLKAQCALEGFSKVLRPEPAAPRSRPIGEHDPCPF
ncbi:hypothetical protein NKK52_07135 [Mesorhizobium sp. C277A]|uniref:hypothetical protein n=1 Tax=Mesorhizobium sp. C277A TaxID=2956827 RepID=UPI0003CE2E4F|nr:hypothetical protein [Mesorhizobium sp. LSJC277A00]ESW69194.1 hypothetical protein X771_08410 [Mesorhizobium sp. LSJC277A00]